MDARTGVGVGVDIGLEADAVAGTSVEACLPCNSWVDAGVATVEAATVAATAASTVASKLETVSVGCEQPATKTTKAMDPSATNLCIRG